MERLNLIGEMAAGISHEIRNPLTIVKGYLQILNEKKDCLHYKEYFDTMIEEIDRANSIITEFLSIGRNKIEMEIEKTNLNTVINALCPLISADAVGQDKIIKIETEDIPDLLLDSKEIRQLLLNLCRNGLEAMKPGGTVTIRTYVDDEYIILAVQDEGEGIKPEILAKVGTPFFTTKENGTGLGLGICYRIAARYKAIIDINTGSQGTTFFVKFPLKQTVLPNFQH